MSENLVPSKKNKLYHLASDTLNSVVDQLENRIIKADERKGTITILGKKNGDQVSVKIEQNEYGETMTTSSYKKQHRKADLKDEVKRLYKSGVNEQEIAERLGMSQSYVSQLLRK